jgi:hypothetical protein
MRGNCRPGRGGSSIGGYTATRDAGCLCRSVGRFRFGLCRRAARFRFGLSCGTSERRLSHDIRYGGNRLAALELLAATIGLPALGTWLLRCARPFRDFNLGFRGITHIPIERRSRGL